MTRSPESPRIDTREAHGPVLTTSLRLSNDDLVEIDVNITRVGVRSLTLAFRFRRGDTIDENGVGPMPNHR